LVLGFMALFIWLTPKLFRLIRRGIQAIRARWRGGTGQMPASGPPPLESKS